MPWKVAMMIFISLVLLFPLQTVAGSAPPQTVGPASQAKVTLISIPGFSFQELMPDMLDKLPNLQKWIADGAIGAMNARTPSKGIDDSYLTLGAGAPVISSADYQAYQRTEFPGGMATPQLYSRYTGLDPGQAEILIPGVEAIRRLNESEYYGAVIGLLGESLTANGVAVYVLGNADRGVVSDAGEGLGFRYAPLMVMNRAGAVAHGVVDDRGTTADATRSFAVKTNYRYLFDQWKAIRGPALVMIELGDLDRLFAEKHRYAPSQFEQAKLHILQEMDQFIGQVLEIPGALSPSRAGGDEAAADRVWLFSPMAHSEAMSAKWMLTPLLTRQAGDVAGSRLLLSDTTRRAGIVANVDLAPTLLRQFRIPVPAEMIGLSMHDEGKPDALASLIEQMEQFARVYRLRPKLLYSIVVFEVIVLLVSLWMAIRKNMQGLKWMRIPLFSILLAPLVLLWMGGLAGTSTMVMMVFFAAAITVFTGLAVRLPLLLGLGITGALEAWIIVADGFAGAPLMKRSVLGYDPMIGARYYGIGNEYMGVLIGAAIMGCSMLLQLRSTRIAERLAAVAENSRKARAIGERRIWPALLAGLTIVIVVSYLASPRWGTNAGGAITAVAAFGVVWVRAFCGDMLKEIHWPRFVLLLGLLFAVSLAVLWLFNGWLPPALGKPSHIGRAMALVGEGRLDQIGRMIVRKLQMNLHLIGVSSWSKVLLTSLLVIAMMVMKPWGLFRRWQERYPLAMYGFSANSVGAIVALLVNDSGIVAASTMIVYTAVPLLLLKLEE